MLDVDGRVSQRGERADPSELRAQFHSLLDCGADASMVTEQAGVDGTAPEFGLLVVIAKCARIHAPSHDYASIDLR